MISKQGWQALLASFMIVIVALTLIPSTFAQTYSAQENIKQETYDLSLFWSKTFGSKEWARYTLWDEALTHCYISFKINAGAALSIPANLKVTYPEIVGRGQSFNVKTELNIPNNKEVTISTEFLMKIDLDLPLPTYISGIGLTDDINNIYGGSYDFTFALNSNTVQRVLKTISLGTDDNSLQSFLPSISINDYITVEDLQMNSQTLGQIILGSFKVSFLQLILDAAKTLTSVAPPISAIISALDWLVTHVIKVDTGLLIQPIISAEINSPIYSDKLSLNRYTLNYDQDISSKTTVCTVQDSVSESRYNNQMYVNYGPVNYRLSFDNNWQYYLDLDLNFLGLSLYQNSWTWNLGTYPSIFTDIPSHSQQISLKIKIDEPLHAALPSVNDGDISITATDASGISNLVLVYSTDGVNWERTNMNSQGDNFSAKPINSVQTPTTVYYYFEAIDGDNDRYTIDNNGQRFSYTITPLSAGFLLFTTTSDIWLIVLIAIILIVLIIALIYIRVIKKRGQNSNLLPHI